MDSHVNLAVIRGETSVNLQSTPVYASEDDLFVEPFEHNGSCITFNSPDLTMEVLAVRPGEVPYLWKGVKVTKSQVDGHPCHCISSTVTGVRLNRRNSFRVFVGIEGSMMEMAGHRTAKILVKDISSTGIGFILDKPELEEFKPGTMLHITYEDPDMRFKVDVEGRVVRKAEIDNISTLYGLHFTRLYPQIDQYITKKQLRDRNKKVPPVMA